VKPALRELRGPGIVPGPDSRGGAVAVHGWRTDGAVHRMGVSVGPCTAAAAAASRTRARRVEGS